MSEDSKETDSKELLSALVDGQVEPRQLRPGIDALLRDADLRSAWTRYWLISDVLQHNITGAVESDLFERVQRSVKAEPAIFSPRPRHWSRKRPAIGLALAASVAVVALLGLLTLGDRPGDNPHTVVATVEPTAPSQRPMRMRWDIAQPSVEERLNSYLVNHSEYDSGVRGMLSYARVVGYDGRE